MIGDAQSPDTSNLPPSTSAPVSPTPAVPDSGDDLPVTLPPDICPDPMKVGDTIELTVDSIDPDTGEYSVSYHDDEDEEAPEAAAKEEKALGYKRPKTEKETPELSAKDLES